MRSIPKSQEGLNSYSSNPVDHLDITKTWKGLSSGQAEELIFWEDLFRKVLSDLLHNQLEFLRQETGPSAPENNSTFHSKEDGDFYYIPISILDIVLAMVERFKNTHRRFRWFTSTGNLYKAVAQFVRTHDCFAGGYQDSLPSNRADDLRIGVKFGDPDVRLLAALSQPTDIIAQVVWNPGYLCFEEFDLTPKEGGEFSLTPTYNPPFITPSSEPKSSVLGNIVYTTSASWLRWDPQAQSFCGIVPYLSEAQQQQDQGGELSIVRSHYRHVAYTLRITVRAIITEHLDKKVRFEQSVRARITVNVAPSWIFESSPRLINDLYSPEKGDFATARGSPISPPKINLSEKPSGIYGGVQDIFQPGVSDPSYNDAQCFSCLLPDYPDTNMLGHNPFTGQRPGIQADQNERSSGSDTLRNPVVPTVRTHLDYPSTSHNSFTWDYRVLTPEGTMHKSAGKSMPSRYNWPGPSASQQGLYSGHEHGFDPNVSGRGEILKGTTYSLANDDVSCFETRNLPLQSLKSAPSNGAKDRSIKSSIGQSATNSQKSTAKEHRLGRDESDESIFAGWMRRSCGSSGKSAHIQTDSGYGSASTKISEGNTASGRPANVPASKVPDEDEAVGQSDLYPGNSDSNPGSFATAGSNGSGKSTNQRGESVGRVEDNKERKDHNADVDDRKRRVKEASEEAVRAANLLTLSLQEFQESDFERLKNPWLVCQEKKAEFAQMLRRRSQQEHELLGSDMEDIFFASDNSLTDSADDEASESADTDEGVSLDRPDFE